MLYRVMVFCWRERVDPDESLCGVDWAITDRWGGSSQGVHAAFNLASHVGDDTAAVDTNRHRLARAFDVTVADLRLMDQQHGSDVEIVSGDSTVRPSGTTTPVPRACDALITADADVVLVTLVADCTPVLLLDRAAGLVAAVHAGRKGLVAGTVPTAIEAMRTLGAQEPQALVGPSICGRCYEVPAAMREAAAQAACAAHAVSWTGTPAIDVAAGVVEQLHGLQVPTVWLPGCTRESEDLYSHRRDGRTGRYAGVVRLLAPRRVA